MDSLPSVSLASRNKHKKWKNLHNGDKYRHSGDKGIVYNKKSIKAVIISSHIKHERSSPASQHDQEELKCWSLAQYSSMTVYRPSQSHVTTVTRSRSHQRYKQIEKENSENISHQRICFKDELRVVKSAKMGKLIPQEFVNPSTNHQDKRLKKTPKTWSKEAYEVVGASQ